MVKPVNISLPDDLHERLKAAKGRFTISEVCAEALERKLKEIENRILAIQDMPNQETIIERLRRQREEEMEKWYRIGQGNAKKWIARAPYRELWALAVHYKTMGERGAGIEWEYEKLPPLAQTGLSDGYWDDLVDFWFDWNNEDNCEEDNDAISTAYLDSNIHSETPTPDPIFVRWEQGFVDYVREFWNSIADRL